jgi:MoxR-like ATPase
MINIPYLRPEDEEKLVNFDFKQVRLSPLVKKERIMELRAVITREVFMHTALAKYIRRLVGATRPYNEETEWHHHSPSGLVEKCVDLGASPRATICWGRLVKVWALLLHRRAEVYPEDIQELARYVLPHRVWLGPHAASHGVSVDMVIDDIINSVPVP